MILPFKDDYIFKTMLTRHDSGIIRNSMISAFTGLKIVSSEIAENEPAIETFAYEKPVRFDVNCVTDDGTRVEIEMQAHTMTGDSIQNKHENLRARSLYYMGKLFAAQGAKKYSDMNKAFQIMICDYTVFSDDKFIHRFYYRDGETLLSDYCCIIYVELPKIKKSLEKPFDDMTDDERWAVFVEYVSDARFEKKAREFETRKEFKEAMETLSRISQSDRDRAYYISRLKYEMDTEQAMYNAEERGKAEALVTMAKGLMEYGLPLEAIAKLTKLPLSKIESLRN
jgi:predicted transposase/invertase (TIGR01784 family)